MKRLAAIVAVSNATGDVVAFFAAPTVAVQNVVHLTADITLTGDLDISAIASTLNLETFVLDTDGNELELDALTQIVNGDVLGVRADITPDPGSDPANGGWRINAAGVWAPIP